MTYRETTDYLFGRLPMFERQGSSGYKPGLDTTQALDNYFGNPHTHYKTIHIGGTNGKGTCAHTLSAILQLSGYKVGLYTSPHIVDFRERIKINGQPIGESYVVDFVEKNRTFFEPLQPSFFELTTAMAFKYFMDKKVDIAVVEVGLGGRLDCTNIITPIVSVITNIGLDHTQFLGETLKEIAYEKSGIIKKGVPVVIGEGNDETRPIFETRARDMMTHIIFADDNPEVGASETGKNNTIVYHTSSFGDITGELGGTYQTRNTNTILATVKELMQLGYLWDSTRQEGDQAREIKEAFEKVVELTGIKGRWQTVAEEPRIICDTGHNTEAWEYLGRQLAHQNCHKLHIILGISNDKDVDGIVGQLPTNAQYYMVQANTKRALPQTVLVEKGEKAGLAVMGYNSVYEAFIEAKRQCDPNDIIFVGGSNYTVADLMTDCL